MIFPSVISHFQSKTRKGFTLMEILVYMAVLVIIVLAVSTFLIWATRSNSKAQAIGETSDNARRAMEAMLYEIREAKSIYLPTFSSNQLSLETSHYSASGESSSYIDFYLCGTSLCFKKESANPFALTSDRVEVNNLQFIQVATSSIQINLGINFKNPQNRPEYQASINLISTASLRSY